jgi:hypothetical protein
VIIAFEELFRYDETAGFTKNLKGSIAILMFLFEKRIISWASYVPRNFSVFKFNDLDRIAIETAVLLIQTCQLRSKPCKASSTFCTNGPYYATKPVFSCQKHRLTSISSDYIYNKGEKGKPWKKALPY